MLHQEGFFKTTRASSIYYQYWLPETEPVAILLIVHGLAEHCGRYMNLVNYRVPRGYAVYGVDFVGHGKSAGRRVFVERFEDYLEILKTYFDMVRQWQPGKPVFLVGHSMGGLIGSVYLLDHQSELAEAIRPTLMEWTPERVAQALAEHPEGPELTKLYTLIWQRFVASQMVPAVYEATTIDIDRGVAQLRATGQLLKFADYTKVYEVAETDDLSAQAAESADRLLTPLEVGEVVTLESVRPEQHFTQPPPRFSEASLVKELEEKGIGRPSTYASIIGTIQDRGYVFKKGTALV